jgi:hypothetical protein
MEDKMELTSDEKRIILEGHIRNALTNIYNVQIALLSEQAKENPDSSMVNNLTQQIADETSKRNVLLEELGKL